jgi:hypothetical protein
VFFTEGSDKNILYGVTSLIETERQKYWKTMKKRGAVRGCALSTSGRKGHVVAQVVVTCLIKEAQPSGILGRPSDTGTHFLRVLQFALVSILQMAHTHLPVPSVLFNLADCH